MTDIRLFSVLTLAALALGACTREKASDKEAILFKTSIESSMTKAPVYDKTTGTGTFSTGDILGLYATVESDPSRSLQNYALDWGNTILYWDNVSTSYDVLFCAYYPRLNTVADAEHFDFTVGEAAEQDLLISKGVKAKFAYPVAPEIPLQFTHAMHKLVINLFNSTDYSQEALKSSTVSILGMKPTATFDLLRGEMTGANGEATPVVDRNESMTRNFMLVPQAVTTDAGFVQIDVLNPTIGKSVTYLYKVPATITSADGTQIAFNELEAGKVLILNITVAKTGITLLSGEIAAWQDQGSVNDEAIAQ